MATAAASPAPADAAGPVDLDLARKRTPMTTQQVAEYLHVSVARVRAYISEGRLAADRVGRDWLVKPYDLAHFQRRPNGRPRRPAKPAKAS